jgi:hypothetical protein
MKKIALVGLVTLCSIGAYAQGTVVFDPYVTQYAIDAEIYAPNPTTATVQEQGDTAAQNTAAGNGSTGVTYAGTAIGGQSYSGTAPASIGATSTYYQYGNLFTAELYAVSTTTTTVIPTSATNLPRSGTYGGSLAPVTQYQTTLNTGGGFGAGYFNIANVTPPDAGIPGTGYVGNIAAIGTRTAQTGAAYLGNNAAAEVVAWYNGGGQFNTLAAAQAAGVPWGQSSVFEISGLTEPSSVMTQDCNGSPTAAQPGPTYLLDGDYSSYLQSFNLVTSVPEPSTIALGVIGACAFLARRRKK